MKSLINIILGVFVLLSFTSFGQFNAAYTAYPEIPEGLLEAVAWTNTRMIHLQNQDEGCSGYPKAYGILGLHDDGKGYFRNNGEIVANLSGVSISDQKSSASIQITAYAGAYENIRNGLGLDPNDPLTIKEVLHQLSEIPDSGYVNFLAREMQVYEIIKFMRSNEMAQLYGFAPKHYDMSSIFGDNLAVLSTQKVIFSTDGIRSEQGDLFMIDEAKSTQYGPAIWNPAASCNFSSRNGVAISAITIHTVQGTYAGCISWFQNCSAGVSAHYVVRSSDGQITQMVLEEDKAWHVGTENPYTIGYEHEGYVDNAAWYTEAMYQNSADLSRDIVNSGYGIPPLRTFYGAATVGTNLLGGCTKIKGHQHYANQTHTDPGVNWNWEKYYRLINNTYTPTPVSSANGNLYDTGGASGDYTDDERVFWLIEPANVNSITLNFTTFSVEQDYDYLYIYDGDSIDATLLGVYTGTNSPGIITSSGSALLLEFRSDCSTINAGWSLSYTSVPNDISAPTTNIATGANWYTNDFSIDFADTDSQSQIDQRFYLIAQNELSPDNWYGKGEDGFALEDFENGSVHWTNVMGTYTASSGKFTFSDVAEQNSNSYMLVDQTSGMAYLYEWTQNITSSETSQRAGMHFFCDDATLLNRGNSYFVYLRENDDKIQIFKVVNDVFTLEYETPITLLNNTEYNVKVIFDQLSGRIICFVDNNYICEWTDPSPHISGSAISFRSGGCSVIFDDVKVFKSRGTQVMVSAGPGEEMEIESLGAVPTGKALSVVTDLANNISSVDEQLYLLDFTAPEVSFLNDGIASDIDTFYTPAVEANWEAFDIHSAIDSYEFAVGTLPNLDNVIGWTNAGLAQSMSELITNPVYGQTYYVSVRATNGAGIQNSFLSDGQRYMEGLALEEASLEGVSFYPNPAGEKIHILGLNGKETGFTIYDMKGTLVHSGVTTNEIQTGFIAAGNYHLVLSNSSRFTVRQLIKQ